MFGWEGGREEGREEGRVGDWMGDGCESVWVVGRCWIGGMVGPLDSPLCDSLFSPGASSILSLYPIV